jgi:ribosome recycling factor
MSALDNLYKDIEGRMHRALENVQREFSEIRGGKASPTLLQHLTVDYYGAPTPLNQLAAVTAPEPRMLVIQPWDEKAIVDIERAITQAGLGVNPVVDGKIIRLPIPALTGERRAELVKVVNRMAEEGRVTIRGVRREANESVKKLKTNNLATEDDVKDSHDRVQKLTDKYIEKLNDLLKAKETEIQTA